MSQRITVSFGHGGILPAGSGQLASKFTEQLVVLDGSDDVSSRSAAPKKLLDQPRSAILAERRRSTVTPVYALGASRRLRLADEQRLFARVLGQRGGALELGARLAMRPSLARRSPRTLGSR